MFVIYLKVEQVRLSVGLSRHEAEQPSENNAINKAVANGVCAGEGLCG